MNENIDEKNALNDLVSNGIKIPPQPQVLLELDKLLAAGDYDLREMANILAKDPGLVAMLFKVANSSAFSRGNRINSLAKALSLIGGRQAFNLVRAFALSTCIPTTNRQNFEKFWQHSQDVAQLAALIAEDRISTCKVTPDQAYLAGIFHECGIPLLMQRFPDYGKSFDFSRNCDAALLSEEDARFKVDHCVIGYLVARHWNLPNFICDAIRYHHEPLSSMAGSGVNLLAILQLAIHFQNRLMNASDPAWDSLRKPVMDELGISDEDDDEFFDSISARFCSG